MAETPNPTSTGWRQELTAWYWPMLGGLAMVLLLQFGVQALWQWSLPFWLVIVLYLAFAAGLSSVLGRLANEYKTEKTPVHPASAWPVSGPIRYLGRYSMLFTFLPSSLLSILNPWQLTQQLKQLAGQAKVHRRMRGHYGELDSYQNKAVYRLPFAGEWLIFNGGLTPGTSHSWDVLAQRYAYDFVVADVSFRRHRNQGTRLEDYFCYDAPILAAADGVVVDIQDGISPAPLVGFAVCDFLCRHFAGNYLVIQHADGEFGVYAHLIKGSITCKLGEKVQQGQQIGRCGHTGHSTEPHLHFHLQDGISLFNSMGLPIWFQDTLVDGEQKTSPVALERGQRVEQPH
ncbi:M23 family metallopeptidase [Alkalimonas sp. MEB108]|uniref:M23 family metallopeptidase n=1 Tax=Alkalimonas cellulosilytica TaxID=3058395 RepID=A0ABU7J6I8_9GAMM|nr:M23 family metallopeptidase [Alkalimonas sp. MEB108]MEE2002029.1 M23 family metallopeptidase [Alkalimonas sp. MEB108]